MSRSKTQSVLIAGAGMGGLTAAIALALKGIQVTVIEQAAELGEVGAGIQLQPNATRPLLKLGLGNALADIGWQPDGMTLRAASSGKIIVQPPVERFRSAFPFYQVHRADFHGILIDRAKELGVELLLGQRVTGFEQDQHGVTLTGDQGKLWRADALLGADGVRSAIRGALFGKDTPIFTGNVAYRGLIDASKINGPLKPGGIVGPGRHFVYYYVRRGELINFVAQVETDSWTDESWTTPADADELRALYQGWDPQVDELLSHVESTFKWAMYSRAPLKAWSEGRVCLMGDACHPTLPNLASGAAMAVEDGYILADLMEKYPQDLPTAFNEFYRLRFARCSKIQQASAQMAKFFHIRNPIEQFAKYQPVAVLSRLFPLLVSRRMYWTHDYDATSVVSGR